MDAMTYVVVAGWVLMYFIHVFAPALLTAAVMGLLAAFFVYFGQVKGAVSLEGYVEAMVPVAPIAFVAIFMAWPLGVFFRRLKGWWRRKAAGA